MSGSLWIALSLLLGILVLEMIYPVALNEGFQVALGSPKNELRQKANILTAPFEKRGDIGPFKEEGGYKKDGRFFSDWMDVQRLGERRDYCRMVFPDGGKEEDSFFACALAGTTGLTSVAYRTKAVKDGFIRSRDDYINRIRQDGRDAYCRIIKTSSGAYEPTCIAADDKGFGDSNFLDTNPPDEIKTLVDFYRGCRMWLRFRDDMIDYMSNSSSTTIIQVAGKPTLIEVPNPSVTRGLILNGTDQFIRLGDSLDLTLGNVGSLRSVRAFSVWVKFDEFTNNAHIFDFGNGSGKDNVFLGILGKGDADSAGGNNIRKENKCKDSTVPDGASGAQWCPELRAQDLFVMSKANVDDYTCTGPEIEPNPKKLNGIDSTPVPEYDPTASKSRATLLYEVWDGALRKMQMKINNVIPINAWTHIVITAANMDALRPDIKLYINGNEIYTIESGFLPQRAVTSHNYLGKSNWTDASGEFELRDELLRGAIFDFRMYNIALSESRVKRILQWGMGKLGLDNV